jgi:UDP-glucose 4-epimerase
MSNSQIQLSQMRVAIIGGGGFLGTNLALRLEPLVGELRCFGRRQRFPEIFREISWTEGDIADSSHLDSVLSGCHAIVHLASTSTPSTADRDIEGDAATNVLASLRLFERCIAHGVERVIFLSSGGTVYGIPNEVPTPESSSTNPITAYGVAKLAIEKYLEVFRWQRGLDFRALRVANVYGPYQTADKQQGVIGAFLAKALRNEPLDIWGDGSVVRDYIYIDDVIDAIVEAIVHSGQSRIFNIGSGHGLSINDVVSRIEMLVGRRLKPTYRPSRPADVPISILDCGLAYKELQWHARTRFDDGLRVAAEWIKAQ